MLSLFKKIANYFTPLDEEAEVERAVASAPPVITDDEIQETPTKSDKDVNETPTTIDYSINGVPVVRCDDYGDEFRQTYMNKSSHSTTKKARHFRQHNPGEGKFRLDLDSTANIRRGNLVATTTIKKGKKKPETAAYDERQNPFIWAGPIIKTATVSKPNDGKSTFMNYDTSMLNKNQLPLSHVETENTSIAPKKDSNDRSADVEKKKSGKKKPTSKKRNDNASAKSTRQPEQSSDTTKARLGKRTHQDSTTEPPAKQKRLQSKPTQITFNFRTTRGRAKKLGDHQCLVCGETFFDLDSRDEHAETEHPGTHTWKH
ncbi:hypothetical protein BCR42DRAFT_188100 [Absidia repens]|uniref:C2H2-type domain-containing protein n=1 Tax=Absidia repens TaxID=90262 RepID=A0A1X2IRH7_9FUNG|nr:hypothetical protein BCR42DRAFT_188100 [Absidia repens]